MSLTDCVRVVGAFAALAGASWVAPYAFDWYVLRPLRGALSVARRLLTRDGAVAGSVTWTGHATGVAESGGAASGRAWIPGEPLSEQVERLHQWAEDLFRLVSETKQHADRQVDNLAARLDGQLATIRTDHATLAENIEEDRRRVERLNTDGLPLIALGIFMCGWPESLLPTWVASLFLAAALVVAIRSAWLLRRAWLARR